MGHLICISGPASSGKSTLIGELKKHLPDAVFVMEWARRLFTEQYSHKFRDLDQLLDEKPFEFQLQLANLTLGNKTEGKLTIIDRAPLDIFIYSLLNMGKISAQGLMEIMQIVMSSCADVDAVFMTRDLGFCEDDGFRSEKYRQLRKTEIFMFEHYPAAMMKHVVWLPGRTEDRVATVLSYLEEIGAYSGKAAKQLQLF